MGGVRRTFSQPSFNGTAPSHNPPPRSQFPKSQSVSRLPVSGSKAPNPIVSARSSMSASGQSKQSSVTISQEEQKAVESLKPQLESMVSKYNEFIKRQKHLVGIYTKNMPSEEKLKYYLTELNFKQLGIPYKTFWLTGYFTGGFKECDVNADDIKTLEECYDGWDKIWELSSLFLTKEDHDNYKNAFSGCTLSEDMPVKEKIGKIKKQRALIRRIFRYIQRVQDTLFERTNGGENNLFAIESEKPLASIGEKPDLKEYIKLEKDTDNTFDINKTLETDNSQKVKACFKNAIGKFIKSNGELVESFKFESIKSINDCFNNVGDKKFIKALKKALSRKSDLEEWGQTNISTDVSSIMRAAMGVLFISMAYLDSPKDVAAACDGLKDGGLKGKQNSNDFVKNGSEVRKAIKDAARGGFLGEKIINLLQSTKVKDPFSFFIGSPSQNVGAITKIMNECKPQPGLQPQSKKTKKKNSLKRKASKLVKGAKKLVSNGAKGAKKIFGFGGKNNNKKSGQK